MTSQRRVPVMAVAVVVLLVLITALEIERFGSFLRGWVDMSSSSSSQRSSNWTVRDNNISSTKPTNATAVLLDGIQENPHQPPAPTLSPTENPEEIKYLQYYVQGGWGNQIQCLSSAYFIAWATNRTLILSPVTPHGYLKYKDVFDIKNTKQFRVDFDLRQAYRNLGSYLRLDKVLDVEYSLSMVPTIDFEEFYETRYPILTATTTTTSARNSTTWVMETNYSHHNTLWMVGQPELEGLSEKVHAKEHDRDYHYTVVVRDLEKVGRSMSEYRIWTLLDSYRAIRQDFPSSHMNLTTRLERASQSRIRPRFSSWIRQTARTILDNHGWSMDTLSYASVHIRGSDGPFKKPEAVRKAVTHGLDEISAMLCAWAGNHSAFSPDEDDSTNRTVGLFLATDISNLDSDGSVVEKIGALTQVLQTEYNTTLKLLWSKEVARTLPETIHATDEDSQQLLLFVDQQVAACATIGFVGTAGSSFSDLITVLRNDDDRVHHVCQSWKKSQWLI